MHNMLMFKLSARIFLFFFMSPELDKTINIILKGYTIV